MPKCVFIDNGISISPDGMVRPCCHIHIDKDSLTHISDFDWDNSFPDLRKKMENGWAKECNACEKDEIKNGNSPRTRYEKFSLPGNTKTIFDLKITNTCNLSCRMCTPSQSSTWDKIVKQNKDLELHKFHKRLTPIDFPRNWHSKNFDDIKDRFSNVKRLKLTGGEPFLVKQAKAVCQNTIDTGASKDAALKIITNGQVDLDNEWLSILNNFKNVGIDISVDGIGNRYEYIRPGSKFSAVEKFINKIKQTVPHVEISATYLAQTLNASIYYDTQDWAKSMDIEIYNDVDWQLIDPYFMNYSSLKPSLREKFNIETTIPYVEENFVKLVNFMRSLDKIHGTDIEKECPELFDE